MKKALLSLLVFLGVSAVVTAQDSLTAARINPMVGDIFMSNTCDTTGVMPGSPGLGVTWDFSGLIVTSLDTGIAVPCSATPNCAMFPGSTIAMQTASGTTANYAIANSSIYAQNGYYFSSTQYATFSDPMEQLHYPMHYADSFTDSYAGTITYGVIPITAHENGTIKMVYDGFGTLKLPDTTYHNAMRTHGYQLYIDSASVFGIDTVASFVLNSYIWYVSGVHSPVLTVLESDQIGGALHNKIVSFSRRFTGTLGVQDINTANASLELYPNPSTGVVKVKMAATGNDAQLIITDMMGRQAGKIMVANGTSEVTYDASALPKGLYLIQLQNGAQNITRKLELQ